MPKGTTTCIYNEKLGMFKVTKSKGKSISSGGYGVPHSQKIVDVSENCSDSKPLQKNEVHDYLFVEEALFLHERGMLAVYEAVNLNADQDMNNAKTADGTDQQPTSAEVGKLMSTQDIYEIMLHRLKMPLAVYLSYSHLRAQTFIVIRHTKKRLDLIRKIVKQATSNSNASKKRKAEDSGSDYHLGDILVGSGGQRPQQQQMQHKSESDKGKHQECEQNKEDCRPGSGVDTEKEKNHRSSLTILKRQFRNDSFHAPLPQLLQDERSYESETSDEIYSSIAYDVYNPNSNYKKTMPNQPDFYVAICPYAESSPTFSTMKAAIRCCEGIPLKISTVSDGGTVNMFGITDLEVPCI
jgi:hypothetical protein